MRLKRHRVAILGGAFPPSGGGVDTAHYALYELLRNVHDVKLFAFCDSRSSDEVVARSKGRPWMNRGLALLSAQYVRRVDPGGDSFDSQRIASTIPAVLNLNSALRRHRPDIVFVPDFAVPGLALIRPRGAKLVWVAHHNYERFNNVPLLPSSGWYDKFLAHRLEKRALRKFDYAIFPSRYMERVFRQTLHPSLPGSVLRHALRVTPEQTPDRALIRSDMGLAANTVLIYIPSGGTAVKGERYVFEIVRRLASKIRDIRFFISGDVNARLRSEISGVLSENQLIAPGQLSLDENLKYVAAADLAVSPTLLENFSCALMEAQSLGVPCVTFNVGGNRELICDGRTGYVVPYLDIEALVARSAELIMNSDARAAMATHSLSRSADLSDPDKLLATYSEMMESVLDSRPQS